MSSRARFWALAAVLIAVNISGWLWVRHEWLGGARPRLRVLAALPDRDVDQADRFSLVFDRAIMAPDSVGKPVDRALFEIMPRPAGHWEWAAPDRLEFLLAHQLPPGRAYTIRAGSDLASQTGRRLVGKSEFRFATRPLTLISCDVQSADQSHITFGLTFNQPVDPSDALRHMTVRDAASSVSLDPIVLVQKPADSLSFRATRPSSCHVRIEIDATLTGSGGDLAIGEKVIRDLEATADFMLLAANAYAPRLDAAVSVALRFTGDLDTRQPVPKIRVQPEVEGVRVRFQGSYYGGLLLEGPFECGRRYTAQVPAGVKSSDGRVLAQDARVAFEVPDRAPEIRFPFRHGILIPTGNLMTDLRMVNVAGVHLEASRIHANNLVAHLRDAGIQATARKVADRTVPINQPANQPASLALDLRALVGSALGTYHLRSSATNHNWIDDSSIVTVTDLGLTVKKESSGYLVWVTSLTTAKPLGGVRVSAISYNNQSLASATTDALGLVRLVVPENHPDGPGWAISAERGDDLSYILPGQREWLLDEVDQSGRSIPTSYDVMLYSERGVYRPGDTIHLTGIVRDAAGAVPPEFPLAIRMTRPDGRLAAIETVTPDAGRQGTFHVDLPTREDGQTGSYKFTATLPGSINTLGSAQAQVETFVPVRLSLQASARDRFGPGETPVLAAAARYLFGQPAANLTLSVCGTFQLAAFTSKKYPAFTFSEPDRAQRTEFAAIQATLDSSGATSVQLPAAPAVPPGRWRASIDATVTEPGGRSVSQSCSTFIDTTDRFLGLHMPGGRIVAAGQPFVVEWIQRTASDDAAPPGPVEFTLVRVDYEFEYEQTHGRTVWKSVERLCPIAVRTAESNELDADVFRLDFTCPSEGAYRVRAVDIKSGTAAQLDLRASASRHELPATLNHPERVEIVLDKDSYVPGSVAKTLVRSPFTGTLLVTVETDRIIEQRVIELATDNAELQFSVPENLRGGAFITATVVRPVDPAAKSWVPHRAMGMVRLVTNHANRELPLAIVAPKQAEPGQPVRVTIQTGTPADPTKPAIVHFWAVDEGILLTTAYGTPSPLKHFFAKRMAAIRTSDLYSDLLADHERPASITRIGGDDDSAGVDSLRSSPVATRQRQAAVVWRSAEVVGGDGSATIEFVLPKLTGELRLMAVAVDGDRYASTQQAITLTSPLLVEASWPRFVAPQDRFRVPLKLFNTTPEALTVHLQVEATGPIDVDPHAIEQPVVVQPSEPATLSLDVVTSAMGSAEVRITASATADSAPIIANHEATVAVRPVTPLHSESSLHRIDAGQVLTMESPDKFLRTSMRTTLSVGGRPTVQLRPALERLIDYPYGCVEQTASRLIAMLRVPELMANSPDSAAQDTRGDVTRSLIEAGIMRLWSMQTRSGGLGYWPNATQPSLWGTAYAAGFLVDARRAGYKVDERFAGELVGYLQSALENHSEGELNDNLRARVCRVLAAFNRPQLGWLARLSERLDQLDMAGRAHLASAWLEVGQVDRARAALPDNTLALAPATGHLTSQVEQRAVLLNVLLDLDKDHAWIPSLVRSLESTRLNGCWSNTLEDAAALAALARYQSLTSADYKFEGTVELQGGKQVAFDQSSPILLYVDESMWPIRISSHGAGPIFVAATTEGLASEAAFSPYDRQLKVRRRWTSAGGADVDLASLQVGDLVWVETSIAAPSLNWGETVHDIAVVDALPGGFEVENPRLATSAQVAGTHDDHDDQPDRVEFLDDRVVLFTSVTAKTRTFRYLLRTISAGTFALPPIQASSMYDPAFASVHGGGNVEVRN